MRAFPLSTRLSRQGLRGNNQKNAADVWTRTVVLVSVRTAQAPDGLAGGLDVRFKRNSEVLHDSRVWGLSSDKEDIAMN